MNAQIDLRIPLVIKLILLFSSSFYRENFDESFHEAEQSIYLASPSTSIMYSYTTNSSRERIAI